jgi:hypothetical protein
MQDPVLRLNLVGNGSAWSSVVEPQPDAGRVGLGTGLGVGLSRIH